MAATLAVLAAVALSTATQAPAATPGLSLAAYQTSLATTATISNAPTARFGDCAPVHVAVSSDAGSPQGTVSFSVDGVVDTRTLPSSGSFAEMVGCCGSRFSTPLSVGTHHFAIDFTPSGNWAPSHGTGQIVILPAANGSTAAPSCGGVATSGFPHSVDAGLPSYLTTQQSPTQSYAYLLQAAISGLALGVGITVVIGYRRRASA